MKYLAALIAVTALGACSSFPRIPLPTREVPVPVIINVYPELDPIDTRTLKLEPTLFDIPREMASEMVVKNTPECQEVQLLEQTDAFWFECGEFPQDKDSNLFVGFDRDNYENYVLNLARIAEWKRSVTSLIEVENRRREEWRRLNIEERAKLEELETEDEEE